MRTFKIVIMICSLSLLAGLLACTADTSSTDSELDEVAEAIPYECEEYGVALEEVELYGESYMISSVRDDRCGQGTFLYGPGVHDWGIMYIGEMAEIAYIHGLLDGKPLIWLLNSGQWQPFRAHLSFPKKTDQGQISIEDGLFFKVMPDGVLSVHHTGVSGGADSMYKYIYGNSLTYKARQPQQWYIVWDEDNSWWLECQKLSLQRRMSVDGEPSGYRVINCDGEHRNLLPDTDPQFTIQEKW